MKSAAALSAFSPASEHSGMRLGPPLVFTPDLDAAADFYGRLLGLELTGRTERQLTFAMGDAMLIVARSERPAPAGAHSEDAASVITFEVDDLDRTMQRLQAKGVRFLHSKPARNETAGLLYVAFVAPGGIVHELVQRIVR